MSNKGIVASSNRKSKQLHEFLLFCSTNEVKMPTKFNSLNIDYKKVLKGDYARMLVGQVKAVHERSGCRKVACLKMSLDPKLLKYWNAR